jgi:hypothetical protein
MVARLLERAKRVAAQQSTTLKELVEAGLRHVLRDVNQERLQPMKSDLWRTAMSLRPASFKASAPPSWRSTRAITPRTSAPT